MCPFYDFECSNCNNKEEILLQINKRNEEKFCPKCNKPMSRLIGKGNGFILKGEGFYCNRNKRGESDTRN